MMRILFIIAGLTILSGYAWTEWHGLTVHHTKREFIPHGLRSASHGGYRSYWTSGFHGGK